MISVRFSLPSPLMHGSNGEMMRCEEWDDTTVSLPAFECPVGRHTEFTRSSQNLIQITIYNESIYDEWQS